MSTETTQTQPRARTSPLLTLAEASAITRTPIASLRRWEGLAVTRESLRADASHRAAFVRVLRECRPLPIVKAIEADALANAL